MRTSYRGWGAQPHDQGRDRRLIADAGYEHRQRRSLRDCKEECCSWSYLPEGQGPGSRLPPRNWMFSRWPPPIRFRPAGGRDAKQKRTRREQESLESFGREYSLKCQKGQGNEAHSDGTSLSSRTSGIGHIDRLKESLGWSTTHSFGESGCRDGRRQAREDLSCWFKRFCRRAGSPRARCRHLALMGALSWAQKFPWKPETEIDEEADRVLRGIPPSGAGSIALSCFIPAPRAPAGRGTLGPPLPSTAAEPALPI